MDQLKGDVPPVTANVWLYDVPMVAPGNAVVVTTGAALTIMDNAWSSKKDFASVARTVKLAVSAVVGVPLLIPVLLARLKPTGKLPVTIDQVRGAVPPLATNVWLYAVPAVAPGKLAVVTTGRSFTVISRVSGVGSESPRLSVTVKVTV
jgi:hypothetical protein